MADTEWYVKAAEDWTEAEARAALEAVTSMMSTIEFTDAQRRTYLQIADKFGIEGFAPQWRDEFEYRRTWRLGDDGNVYIGDTEITAEYIDAQPLAVQQSLRDKVVEVQTTARTGEPVTLDEPTQQQADTIDELYQLTGYVPPGQRLEDTATVANRDKVIDYVPLAERAEFDGLSDRGQPAPGEVDARNQYAATLRDHMATIARGMGADAFGNPGAQADFIFQHGNDATAQQLWNDVVQYRQYEFGLRQASRGGPMALWTQDQLQLNEFHGLTWYEAKAAFASLNDQDLAAFKIRMMEAGYYDSIDSGTPILAQRGDADAIAFARFLDDNTNNPDLTMDDVLEKRTNERYERMRIDNQMAQIDLMNDLASPETYTLNSVGMYSRLAREMMESELGLTLDDDTLRGIGERAQARERAHEQNTIRSFRDAIVTYTADATGELDLFMRAIGGQESSDDYDATNVDSGAHGKYQIMPSNWPQWSQRAGLGPGAPQTPENQEIVARTIMQGYYTQFGNWRDVAIAWYAGPGSTAIGNPSGAAANADQSRGDNYYPTINAYADEVLQRMLNLAHQDSGAAGGPINWIEQVNWDSADAARSALLDGNQTQRQTWQYAQRGADFQSMLGSAL